MATAYVSLEERFGPDLLPGERVLWTGQPDPSVLFSPADRFLVPFSLLWGGFSFFWEAMVIASLLQGEDRSGNGGSLWMFVFFGIPFVVIGFYFIVGRFVAKRFRKKRTYYAVTTQRVLVLTHLRSRHLNAAFIDRIPSVQKSVRSDGIGTVHFGDVGWFQAQYQNTGMEFFGGSQEPAPAFFDIREAEYVYGLVNDVRKKQRVMGEDAE
jgi:hypothetical protein